MNAAPQGEQAAKLLADVISESPLLLEGITATCGITVCPECLQDIDEEVCWCGSPVEGHNPVWDGHTAVPMGCLCSYADVKHFADRIEIGDNMAEGSFIIWRS